MSKGRTRSWGGLSSNPMRVIGRLRLPVLFALMSGAILAGATAAHADYPVQQAPLTVAPGSPQPAPGVTVTIEGGGYVPGSLVSIDVHSTVVHLTSVRADATGFIKATVTLPTSLAGGSHELTASGPAPGGGTNTLAAKFTVAGGSLPFTGIPVLLIGGLAVAALVAGGLLVVVSRRRGTAQLS